MKSLPKMCTDSKEQAASSSEAIPNNVFQNCNVNYVQPSIQPPQTVAVNAELDSLLDFVAEDVLPLIYGMHILLIISCCLLLKSCLIIFFVYFPYHTIMLNMYLNIHCTSVLTFSLTTGICSYVQQIAVNLPADFGSRLYKQ